MLTFLTIKRINKMNNKSYISGNAVYLLILVFLAFGQSYAQVSASANFIKGGKDDAVKIISAYLLPVERALSFDGANNNILLFKSNKTSDLNYGIGINLTTSFVNSKDYTFDVNKLNLTEFEAKDPNKTIAQTIAEMRAQSCCKQKTNIEFHLQATLIIQKNRYLHSIRQKEMIIPLFLLLFLICLWKNKAI